MSNSVRRVSFEDSNRNPPSSERVGSHLELHRQTLSDSERGFFNPSKDPYRARFLQIADPGLRKLKAEKLSPSERKVAERSILEQFLHFAERKLEGL